MNNFYAIKVKLHDLIKNGDYKGLKKYVDGLQSSIVNFDDPSLLIIAVEIYLDPKSIISKGVIVEIIVFLIKSGLSIYVPKGDFVLHVVEYVKLFPKMHTDVEFDILLKRLFEVLLINKQKHILCNKPTDKCKNYNITYDYLMKYWACLKIQKAYRKYRSKKSMFSNIQ